MTILSVKNIKKSYGKHEVLKDISFNIEKPEIVALVGPNGSGKSTLLNIIANLLTEDSGTVEILGKSNKDVSVFQKFSYMIDNTVLYDYLTGLDHLKFVSETHKLPKTAIEEYAGLIGIKHFLNRKVKEYSLGMKQQLLFTMSLMNDPDIVILDEPFNGLDPTTIIKVREILVNHHKRGKSVILSSHNLAEVDQMTSHILFLKDGRLIEEDISKYQESVYHIKVEDIEVVKKSIDEFNFKTIDNEIIVSTKDADLNDIIHRITNISEIISINQELKGSEDTYKEIFNIN